MENFILTESAKENIKRQIRETFETEHDVLFAYIFGSFLDNAGFRDIDIGIYLRDGG